MDQTCVLGSVLFAAIVVFGAHASSAAETDDSAMLSVDYEKLVSSADITLNRPVSRREAGMPIGTGRMGSLVWTTPSAMKFQINHTDVYASGGATNSFFHRESDYAFGLGFVDIRLVDFGPDVFTRQDTRQHLTVYDALLSLVLTQKFTEGDYYCGSALAIRVLGRDVQVKQSCHEQMEIVVAPGSGTLTVLMASVASFDPKHDLIELSLAKLSAAADRGFDGLLSDNQQWWHRFWSQGFVHLHSDDGQADYVQQHYNYYLYVMASSSRGDYPARFGGMIWKTGGDFCRWGTKHWWHNLSCYTRAILESNRPELIDPMFNILLAPVRIHDGRAVAARPRLPDAQGDRGVLP